MLRYNLLFIHIASAMAICAALGMEAVALAQLRSSSDGAATRRALAALGPGQRLAGLGGLGLLLTGLPLATIYWHWHGPWMGLGLLGLIAIGAIGGSMTGRIVRQLRARLEDASVGTLLADAIPRLRQSLVIRVALFAGVVYLMTLKPGGSP
ncbi:MAG: hypothetical protein ACREN6_07265 [Gemmatimonadaceae bacterium]